MYTHKVNKREMYVTTSKQTNWLHWSDSGLNEPQPKQNILLLLLEWIHNIETNHMQAIWIADEVIVGIVESGITGKLPNAQFTSI